MRKLLVALALGALLLLLAPSPPARGAIGCPTPTFKFQVVCLTVPDAPPTATPTPTATPRVKPYWQSRG